MVWLMLGGLTPKLRTDRVATRTTAMTKREDIPSRLGVVMAFIFFKACSTSTIVWSLVSSLFICGVTFLSIPCRIESNMEGQQL